MRADNLILAIMKPALRKKFGFSVINSCVFVANKHHDTLTLEGWGVKKGGLPVEEYVKLNELKLSENSEFEVMFLKRLEANKEFNPKEITAAEISILFEGNNKHMSTIVYYITQDGIKAKKTFKVEF